MSNYQLTDFAQEKTTLRIQSLNNPSIQQEQYVKILKHLKTNKLLEMISKNEETRKAVLETCNS